MFSTREWARFASGWGGDKDTPSPKTPPQKPKARKDALLVWGGRGGRPLPSRTTRHPPTPSSVLLTKDLLWKSFMYTNKSPRGHIHTCIQLSFRILLAGNSNSNRAPWLNHSKEALRPNLTWQLAAYSHMLEVSGIKFTEGTSCHGFT